MPPFISVIVNVTVWLPPAVQICAVAPIFVVAQVEPDAMHLANLRLRRRHGLAGALQKLRPRLVGDLALAEATFMLKQTLPERVEVRVDL